MGLARYLDSQKQALIEFVSLLEEERTLLSYTAINGKELIDLTAKKTVLVERLNAMESQRCSILKKLNYPDGMAGAKQAAKDSQCEDLWDEIVSIAFRSKQLNEANGEFVRLRLEQNQRMVNMLRDATGDTGYGPDGKAKKRGQGRINIHA